MWCSHIKIPMMNNNTTIHSKLYLLLLPSIIFQECPTYEALPVSNIPVDP